MAKVLDLDELQPTATVKVAGNLWPLLAPEELGPLARARLEVLRRSRSTPDREVAIISIIMPTMPLRVRATLTPEQTDRILTFYAEMFHKRFHNK